MKTCALWRSLWGRMRERRQRQSRLVGGWKGLKPLVSHRLTDTGWRSRSHCDWTNTSLRIFPLINTAAPSFSSSLVFGFSCPLPILAPLLDCLHFHTPSSPLSRFAFLLCHRAFGVTVGCAASCLLSPTTPGSDRKNYFIYRSLLCYVGLPRLLLSHRSSSLLTTNSAFLQVL